MVKRTAHKHARRHLKTRCEAMQLGGLLPGAGHLRVARQCQETKRLQVHHIDGDPWNNSPSNLVTLCQEHHKDVHVQDGTWGKGNVQSAACAICGVEFQPRRSNRATLCGDPECRRELGRRSRRRQLEAA